MGELIDWLRQIGMEKYASVFQENEISISLLPLLTEEDLIAIGISKVGPRRTILSACAELPTRSRLFSDASWNLGRSEIILGECIGRGHFGSVFRGSWRGQVVAVKSVSRNFDVGELEVFTKEVDIISACRSPNIVMFMGACFTPPDFLLVMELVARGSLRGVIQRYFTQLSLPQKYRMLLDVARGINYLHLHTPQIVHGDLSSHNILVSRDWTCKISDFGVSRTSGENVTASESIGHLKWQAPEVLRGSSPSTASDVFSFGLILWELFAGVEPYSDINPVRVAQKVAYDHLRPTDSLCQNMPEGLRLLMMRCWVENPLARPVFSDIVTTLDALWDDREAHVAHMDVLDDGAYSVLSVTPGVLSPRTASVNSNLNGLENKMAESTGIVQTPPMIVSVPEGRLHSGVTKKKKKVEPLFGREGTVKWRVIVGHETDTSGCRLFVRGKTGQLNLLVTSVIFGFHEHVVVTTEPYEAVLGSLHADEDVDITIKFADFYRRKPMTVVHHVGGGVTCSHATYVIELDMQSSAPY